MLAAGPPIDFKNVWPAFQKRLAATVLMSYFNMKRNWIGNCFERFRPTSPFISICSSEKSLQPYHHWREMFIPLEIHPGMRS